MKKNIEIFINACHECLSNKPINWVYGHRSLHLPTGNPWEVVGLDVKGPYTVGQTNLYCPTIIDFCQRWCELIAIDNLTSDTAVNK